MRIRKKEETTKICEKVYKLNARGFFFPCRPYYFAISLQLFLFVEAPNDQH